MEALEAAIAAGAPCKQLATLAEALPRKASQKNGAKPSGHAAAAASALCKAALNVLDAAIQKQQQNPPSKESKDDDAHWAAAAASRAVDALEACRECIKGAPDEPEAQRYSLLRRLVGLRRYDAAFVQGSQLLTALSDAQRGSSAAKVGLSDAQLRLSAPRQEESQRRVVMVVGCTLNVILCAAELAGDRLNAVAELLNDIEPWTRSAPPM